MFSPTRFWTLDSLSVAVSVVVRSLRQHHPHLNLLTSAVLVSEAMVVGAAWLTGQLTLESTPGWLFAGVVTAIMAFRWVHSPPDSGERDPVVDVDESSPTGHES